MQLFFATLVHLTKKYSLHGSVNLLKVKIIATLYLKFSNKQTTQFLAMIAMKWEGALHQEVNTASSGVPAMIADRLACSNTEPYQYCIDKQL